MMMTTREVLCCTLLVAGMVVPIHGQDPEPVQPEDYGQWESLGSGTLSPNGQWLAVPISRVNRENETRWTMNCRFKGAFTPYADKKLGEFFEPITLRPATRLGLEYRLPGGWQDES